MSADSQTLSSPSATQLKLRRLKIALAREKTHEHSYLTTLKRLAAEQEKVLVALQRLHATIKCLSDIQERQNKKRLVSIGESKIIARGKAELIENFDFGARIMRAQVGSQLKKLDEHRQVLEAAIAYEHQELDQCRKRQTQIEGDLREITKLRLVVSENLEAEDLREQNLMKEQKQPETSEPGAKAACLKVLP
ncbi:hypothetical protein JNK13_05955 [bacterium]|nr:hypothetical protein [bacterium]